MPRIFHVPWCRLRAINLRRSIGPRPVVPTTAGGGHHDGGPEPRIASFIGGEYFFWNRALGEIALKCPGGGYGAPCRERRIDARSRSEMHR